MRNTFSRQSFPAAIGLLLLLVLMVAPAGCGGSAATALPGAATVATPAKGADPQPLLVSAAAGLKNAFTEIGRVFDQSNNAETTFNFNAAGALQKQIEGGAPADVFASADPKQMNNLLSADLADAASVRTFAGNEIVLIVPADSNLGITGFEDLAKAVVERVATGDPKITPLGGYAHEVLSRFGILDNVKPKLIYAQTVNQTVDYVARGEVDAGVVWASEAMARGDDVETVATADPSWHGEVAFVIGIVTASRSKSLGQSFIDFVLSPEGQSILRKHGFLLPQR